MSAQFFQHGRKFRRQGAGEGDKLLRAGVDELQPHGVEALALETRHGLFRAVDRVAQDRVANMGHVDADLVGAARFQAAADVGEPAQVLQHLPVGHGGAAVEHHSHFFSVAAAAADGGVHGAGKLPESARADGFVGPGQGVVGKLGGEEKMGRVVFGSDDQARGVPVDAVDDAGPLFPAHAGKAVAAVAQQGVDQRAVAVARGGVDHHARGLVDHDHVLVLIDHVQRDVLGQQGAVRGLGQGDGDLLSARELIVLGRPFPVDQHRAALDELLGSGSAHALQRGGEEAVDAPAGVLRAGAQHRRGAHGASPSSCSPCSAPRSGFLGASYFS